jgi:hypothetical protein
VNDLPITGVEPYVADAAVEEHQITQLEIRLRNMPAPAVLLSRRVRQAYSDRSPGAHRQPRAVP